MTQKNLKRIVSAVLEEVSNRLTKKGDEYSPIDDVFYNFKVGSRILGKSEKETLVAYMTKHIATIVNDSNNTVPVPTSKVEESVIDTICYLILYYAMCVEGTEESNLPHLMLFQTTT